ncbi:MAG: MFS transporter [bacterium]|nr:MFS transporter [bacterium]
MEWINGVIKKLRMPPINQVILIIIFAEFVFTIGSALIGPLVAIFVTKDIGAPVTVVGFSVAIYWVIKSVLQLPVARYLDKNHGEIDDYYSTLIGLAISITAVYLYYFVQSAWHIYALQALIGIGDALVVPAFQAIFTRHLDKDQEASELALRSSFSYGIGSALGGALSGILALAIGIRSIYLINGTLLLIGFFILLFLRPYVRPRVPKNTPELYIPQSR